MDLTICGRTHLYYSKRDLKAHAISWSIQLHISVTVHLLSILEEWEPQFLHYIPATDSSMLHT